VHLSHIWDNIWQCASGTYQSIFTGIFENGVVWWTPACPF